MSLFHIIRTRAHGVQDGIRVISLEVPENNLHGGVIAHIARAKEAEQADTGSGSGPLTLAGEPMGSQHGLRSRPGTTASTGMIGLSAGAGSPARASRPGRTRLATCRDR